MVFHWEIPFATIVAGSIPPSEAQRLQKTEFKAPRALIQLMEESFFRLICLVLFSASRWNKERSSDAPNDLHYLVESMAHRSLNTLYSSRISPHLAGFGSCDYTHSLLHPQTKRARLNATVCTGHRRACAAHCCPRPACYHPDCWFAWPSHKRSVLTSILIRDQNKVFCSSLPPVSKFLRFLLTAGRNELKYYEFSLIT